MEVVRPWPASYFVIAERTNFRLIYENQYEDPSLIINIQKGIKKFDLFISKKCGCYDENGAPKNGAARTCVDRDTCRRRQYSIDCGNFCANQLTCCNRPAADPDNQVLNPLCEVREVAGKGNCLFTLEHIEANQFVLEYMGMIRAFADIDPAADEYSVRIKYTNLVIDPTLVGNLSRFASHSHDPNMEMITQRSDNKLQNFLVALRKIEPNEELTFNYNKDIPNCQCTLCTSKLDDNLDYGVDDAADPPQPPPSQSGHPPSSSTSSQAGASSVQRIPQLKDQVSSKKVTWVNHLPPQIQPTSVDASSKTQRKKTPGAAMAFKFIKDVTSRALRHKSAMDSSLNTPLNAPQDSTAAKQDAKPPLQCPPFNSLLKEKLKPKPAHSNSLDKNEAATKSDIQPKPNLFVKIELARLKLGTFLKSERKPTPLMPLRPKSLRINDYKMKSSASIPGQVSLQNPLTKTSPDASSNIKTEQKQLKMKPQTPCLKKPSSPLVVQSSKESQRYQTRLSLKRKRESELSTFNESPIKKSADSTYEYGCRKCTKTFATRRKWYDHQNYHSAKTFACETCHMAFSIKNMLRRHLKVHLPREEKFIHLCRLCQKCFTRNEHVNRHLKVCPEARTRRSKAA